jgi:cobyrinic acid a,c-diamide synthase
MTAPGIILAAPSSGSGKTLVTLGLLAHLAGRGVRVASAKVGPDYIDPAFHAAATGRPCLNLDSWAMRPTALAGLAAHLTLGADHVVCEGVMGLFDGADTQDGEADGCTAEIAALTGWPVVLVVDARGMAASAGAMVLGFARAKAATRVAGVIFNRVSGDKHRRLIERSCRDLCPEVRVLGHVPPLPGLAVPSRHLGLVQAREHPDLTAFLAAAAQAVAAHVDIDALMKLGRPSSLAAPVPPLLPPLGQRIAVAHDDSFAFAYPAVLDGWRRAGAELTFFSPLSDQSPDGDSVFLPGGYPELHAPRLAAAATFLDGLRQAAAAGKPIFGECGGFMVLGRAIVDSDGTGHPMAGLLPLETSFAKRKLHLGYRQLALSADCALGPAGTRFRGHEFHYATVTESGPGTPLFLAQDAAGTEIGPVGLVDRSVFASFMHLIDRT